MDVLVGTDATFRVEFTGPTGTLAADASSIVWYLYDNSGTLAAGPTSIANVADVGFVTIPVANSFHTVAGDKRFEKRTLVTRWLSGGKTYSDRQNYRVIPFLNHAVTADDVRGLLGLNADELLDDEIDIVAAYFDIEAEITQATLETALRSGSTKEVGANRSIAAQAAIQVLPSLQIRVGQTAANGELRFERFRTPPNWQKIEDALRAVRQAGISTATGATTITPALLVLTDPTDVITG